MFRGEVLAEYGLETANCKYSAGDSEMNEFDGKWVELSVDFEETGCCGPDAPK
jgi:hypothetical protein